MNMAGLEELSILLSNSAVEQAEQFEVNRFRREPQNCFEISDKKFIKLFRLNKNMASKFISALEPYMEESLRTSALTVEEKVFACLRFFAAGSYQPDVGQNFNISMSQPSVSRSINEVINAVHSSGFFDEKVKFHTNLYELKAVRQNYRFYENYGFPGVVGCIDCTHVAIVPPVKEDDEYPEHVYVNRKHYHSINVQLICDADLKIINVNAKYPGSPHDSYIWNNSNVLPAMQNLCNRYAGSFYLLGDSEYALRPWMMTPIARAEEATAEADYNECQKLTRSIIERVNGVLKMRFRCLLKHCVLHYKPKTASKIINTCCALHKNNLDNVEPKGNDDLLDGLDHELQNDEVDLAQVNPSLLAGRRIQQNVVRRHFSN